MVKVTIQAGLIDATIKSISNFEGKKSIGLAVRLARLQQLLAEYDKAWREEELTPAIKAFTDGDTVVPDDDIPEFTKVYSKVFNDEVNIEIEPLTVEELGDLTIDDFSLRLLLQVGILVE